MTAFPNRASRVSRFSDWFGGSDQSEKKLPFGAWSRAATPNMGLPLAFLNAVKHVSTRPETGGTIVRPREAKNGRGGAL